MRDDRVFLVQQEAMAPDEIVLLNAICLLPQAYCKQIVESELGFSLYQKRAKTTVQ